MRERLLVLWSLVVVTLAACDDAPAGLTDAATDVASRPDVIESIDALDETGECATAGCPCAADSDCDSGYCIEGREDGGRVCAELCTDTCALEGFVCRLLENGDGSLVRLCVPEWDPYCRPCEIAADCLSLRAECHALAAGIDVCVTPCGDNELCPSGAACVPLDGATDGPRFCVPEAGTCEGCVDADGDGYGVGPECAGGDPDDLDNTVYDGAPELCDTLDNDGDGAVDEDFDFANDPTHCGACDRLCEAPAGRLECVEGECVLAGCESGFANCDSNPDNGCEADLSDPVLCGSCKELEGTPGAPCGVCDEGVWACAGAGAVACEGDPGPGRRNVCGGCAPLDGAPGDTCGRCGLDSLVCDGLDALVCDGDSGGNACGGCSVLEHTPGEACGPCAGEVWVCDDIDGVVCDRTPNCAPTAPVVALEPLPATPLDDLQCVVVAPSTDLDDDSITYEFEWLRNGGDPGVGDTDTVAAGSLAVRDVWQCRARASDGVALSEWSAWAITLVADVCDVEECAECGDGVLDAGEECDEGTANSDVRRDACRTSCRTAYCGDEVIDTGETCDDGAANSDTVPGACPTTCRRGCVGLPVPYTETFTGQDGLGAFDSNDVETGDATWTLDTSRANIRPDDLCGVVGGQLVWSDVNGRCEWAAPPLCLGDATSVTIRLVARDLGDLEYTPADGNIDFINVEYSVDGGPRQLVANWNDRGRAEYTLVGDTPDDSDWGIETIVVEGLRGESLQLWVTGGNNGADDDMSIDDVSVSVP